MKCELWVILFSADAILASSTSKFRHWNTTSRINQLHFFDSLQCSRKKFWTSTYLRFEPYFPASKGCWWTEFVKVESKNLQSLFVCPIILWRISSTEDDWIFGWRSKLVSQILILFWAFTFLRCRHVKPFINGCPPLIQFFRLKADEDACAFAKTFPGKPCVSQMLGDPSLRRGDTKKGLNIPSGIRSIQRPGSSWNRSYNLLHFEFLVLCLIIPK